MGRVQRRTFLFAAAILLAVPVRAQQAGKIARIGYLSTPTRESVERGLNAFLRKLRELGWVEGQNLNIEYRWAEGDVSKLSDLADQLVRDKVELIVAPAGTAAQAAQKATSTIPIVIAGVDPPPLWPLSSSPSELGVAVNIFYARRPRDETLKRHSCPRDGPLQRSGRDTCDIGPRRI